jgi:carbon monoxide dehydrogenase subunit G
MLVDGQFTVRAAPEALMQHLLDPRLMASCLPGCEALERLDDDRYKAQVAVALAGVQARFELLVQITRREALAIWATTRGDEGGQASTLQADSEVHLAPADGGTQVSFRSEVSITGRLGRFALGMMKKKAQSLADEFAANLRVQLEALEGVAVAPLPAQAVPVLPTPLSWWRRLWMWLRGGAAQPRSQG